MPDLPASLALGTISGTIAASPHNTNYGAVQTAINALIAALSGGSSGQVLRATDADTIAWSSTGGLYRKTTAKQVINTAAETDLLNGEITVAANVMGTTGILRLTAWGDWLNNSGGVQNVPAIKVKLGATTVMSVPAMVGFWSAGATRQGWRVVAEIGNAGATNSQTASFLMRGYNINSVGNGLTNFVGANNNGSVFVATAAGGFGSYDAIGDNHSLAADTTIPQALTLTCTHGAANPALDMTLRGAIVEVL